MLGVRDKAMLLIGIPALLLITVTTSASAACHDLKTVVQVSEDTPVGTILDSITAHSLTIDKSQPAGHVDVIDISNQNGHWTIKLNKLLDAEQMFAIAFTVKCQDDVLIPDTARDYRLVVTDVNEFAPVFQGTSIAVSVNESTTPNSTVFTFSTQNKATDGDATGNTVTYSIVDGADGYFRMSDVQQGTVILSKPLDYEQGPINFTLSISAEDSGTPRKEAFSSLIINVEDVDDVNPMFFSSAYILTIPEGDYSGNEWFETTPILFAHDGDRSLDEEIVYSIDKSTEFLYPNVFSVAQNGSLSVNGHLDIGKYSVNIKAYQKNEPLIRFALAVVVVTVTDVNDHHPVMGKAQYFATVSEGLPVNTIVFYVTARDDDQGNNAAIEFKLDNTSTNNFVVETDGNYGLVKLKRPLDAEVQNMYVLQIWAEETLSMESYSSNKTNVTITVTDENDNSPVFAQTSYAVSVARTTVPGTRILTVAAYDADRGHNGEVSYSLQPSSFSPAFLIDNITGGITLARSLTTADVGRHDFTVVATDNPTDVWDRRSAFAVLEINVLPIEGDPPKMTTPSHYVSPVAEPTSETTTSGQAPCITKQEKVNGLTLVVNTRYILTGQTPYLSVNCSFSHAESRIAHLASLVLSRLPNDRNSNFKEMVSLDAFSPNLLNVQDNLQGAFVNGTITSDVSKTSYVAVSWIQPNQLDTVYRCEANTLDKHGHDETFTEDEKVINLDRKNASELLGELQTVGAEIVQLENSYRKVTRENTVYQEMMFDSSDILDGRRYYLSKFTKCQFLSIKESAEMCGVLGGYLAEVNNDEEFTIIKHFLENKVDNVTNVIISGHYDAQNGHWMYSNSDRLVDIVDGKSVVSNTSVAVGEGKNCLALGLVGSEIIMKAVWCDGGVWSDSTAYLCETPQ